MKIMTHLIRADSPFLQKRKMNENCIMVKTAQAVKL